MGIVVAIGVAVCLIGVQNGLEKVTKIMMLALLAIMVVLAINSFTMPGGAEGLSFYLMPDLSAIEKVGITNILVSAMNQAFFTLSIGMGSMAIFGSYIGKDRSLLGESVNVALLDTFVAVASGLIIFPACSAKSWECHQGSIANQKKGRNFSYPFLSSYKSSRLNRVKRFTFSL